LTKTSKFTISIVIGGILLIFVYFIFWTDIQNAYYTRNAIFWNKDYQISYNDLVGDVNDNSKADMSIYMGLNLKSSFFNSVSVRAFLDKDKSWVSDTTKFEYDKEIELNQVRFNIYEAYSRKFNYEISEIENLPGTTFENYEIIGEEIYSEINSIESEMFDSNISTSKAIEIWRPVADSLLNYYSD